MTHVIPLALLLIMFFTFIVDSTQWSLQSMKLDINMLDHHAEQFRQHRQNLLDADL